MEIRVFFFKLQSALLTELSSCVYFLLFFLGSLSILMLLFFGKWGEGGSRMEEWLWLRCVEICSPKRNIIILLLSISKDTLSAKMANSPTIQHVLPSIPTKHLDIYGFQFLSNLIFLSLYCFICDFSARFLCVFILFVYIYSRV